jgi:hypothetical protein
VTGLPFPTVTWKVKGLNLRHAIVPHQSFNQLDAIVTHQSFNQLDGTGHLLVSAHWPDFL